ncbi:MAG: DUF4437 domain-containing protein [Bdellovibrionales bacterium]|nr:DUF4437 domain-containing protein [Bdellovibrionales bacterium]
MWNNLGPAKVVSLWKNKNGQVTGSLIKFKDKVAIDGKSIRMVVVDGSINLEAQQSLEPGSLISFNRSLNSISCTQKQECILYLKSNHKFSIR